MKKQLVDFWIVLVFVSNNPFLNCTIYRAADVVTLEVKFQWKKMHII